MKKTILIGSLFAIAGLASCGKTGTSVTNTTGTDIVTGTETVTTTTTTETTTTITDTETIPSISVGEAITADFANVAKDQDMSDTTVSNWTIKASRYSYAGAIKLQNPDDHILSPEILQEGAINVNLNIFATGTAGTPWQFDIIGLNALGTVVETKTIAFAQLPNQQTNAELRTWTLNNINNSISQVKIVYVQKLSGANIGIIYAEIN